MVLLSAGGVATAQSSPWLVNAIHREPVWGQNFRSIVGLGSDPISGEIYVLDAGRRAVDVLDTNGVVVFSFSHWFTDPRTGERQRGEPNSVAVAPSGEVFLTDFFSDRVDVLNIRGEVIGQIDVLGAIGWDSSLCRPEKLAISGGQWLYVSIGGVRGGVARCRIDGSDCRVFLDATAEKIDCITGISAAPDGRLGVLDYRGVPAVRVYSPEGQQLAGFAAHDVSDGDLSCPTAMLFGEDGTYWVADALRHAVKHYSATGEYLDYIGGYGAMPGGLRYPTALSGDGVGRLYVGERVGRRVQEYILPSALAARAATPIPSAPPDSISAVATHPEAENLQIEDR